MPLDITATEIETDFEILEALGGCIDALIETLLSGGALQKTLRRWIVGHAEPPEEDAAVSCLMAMAADLELFTPSASGRTLVERRLAGASPLNPTERQAFKALGAAQLRLVRITGREGADLVRLEDLVTGESLLLLDARISPMAAGLPSAMRLCPLASGRHVLISPLFAITEEMLEDAMKFVRPGRPLGLGHRCAASLYRDAARRGFQPVPQLTPSLDPSALLEEIKELLSPVEELALHWSAQANASPDLVLEARRLASVDHLVDACGCFGQVHSKGPSGLAAAYEEIASLQVETIVQRGRAGVGGAEAALDVVAARIAGHIAGGEMHGSARDLLERLRRKWTRSRPETSTKSASSQTSDMDSVIERIRGLRAKTVDRGCTEAEAMAAAAKVSELLARYDLTLDEISVRRSECEGVRLATGRKRRAAVDACMSPIAEFADCHVWCEEGEDGGIHYVFFGLKADVEAARFLHDLVDAAFDTETAGFRRGDIYQRLSGGDRRVALNSFQHGLARGISGKLLTLKAARTTARSNTTGFDLVAVKHSVVEEEISRLGLNFTTRSATSRRYVHDEAYNAGRVAGSLFEPSAALLG